MPYNNGTWGSGHARGGSRISKKAKFSEVTENITIQGANQLYKGNLRYFCKISIQEGQGLFQNSKKASDISKIDENLKYQ